MLRLELFDLELSELVQQEFLDLVNPQVLLLSGRGLDDVHLLSTLQPQFKRSAVTFHRLRQPYLRHLHPTHTHSIIYTYTHSTPQIKQKEEQLKTDYYLEEPFEVVSVVIVCY